MFWFWRVAGSVTVAHCNWSSAGSEAAAPSSGLNFAVGLVSDFNALGVGCAAEDLGRIGNEDTFRLYAWFVSIVYPDRFFFGGGSELESFSCFFWNEKPLPLGQVNSDFYGTVRGTARFSAWTGTRTWIRSLRLSRSRGL